MALSRSWVYTLNNYTDHDIESLRALPEDRIVVHICAKEVAPTTGTPHLQGYIRFQKPARFSWLSNRFPGIHVEPRRGTEEQAFEYCKKGGDVIIEKGTPSEVQSFPNKQSEFAAIFEKIKEGVPYSEIWMAHTYFCVFNRTAVLNAIRDYKRITAGLCPLEEFMDDEIHKRQRLS